ncbi:MAG: methylenetetrahydrofolate--tRNA-(uracil(54)-C(5))-methyltransferase (FADH(2)-oxidizing) TrmFO [Clostridia bacterium]|nr:methylenetetrahydrofolate--tRNA-(uracil(54)-C(5))-methyltransferase (FADH(2)-oxidizing) TrmFO [Clostridia bacterium]
MKPVTIIGAGLAGSEAAYQLLRRGIPVRLYEMRPDVMTPAHSSGNFAELVCSNSLRAAAATNAVGLLKEEMRRLGSLIIAAADANAVPAGSALAVDRRLFSLTVEQTLRAHPLLTVVNEEMRDIPAGGGLTIIAAGPLPSPALSRTIADLTGEDHLFFHDAIAPIIDADSIDIKAAFFASRYGKGSGDDYLNCPMGKAQYRSFWQALVHAEVTPLHDFEQEKHFAACMPVESMARYGEDALRFGPLKPVGLELPQGGEAYAVVQLRRENREGSAYNMVGFQTRLRHWEQRRVFQMIPGLQDAEFLRYGSMHRNTYINAPRLLDGAFRLKQRPEILFAGQISGVEGYVESAASGLMAGIFAAALMFGEPLPQFPRESAHGALLHHLSNSAGNFQPSNVNFSLFPPVATTVRQGKAGRNLAYSERALQAIDDFIQVYFGATPFYF